MYPVFIFFRYGISHGIDILFDLVSAIDDIDCIINGIFHGIRPTLNRRYSKYHVTVSANAMVSTTGCIAALC